MKKLSHAAALLAGSAVALFASLASALPQVKPCDPLHDVCPEAGYGLPRDISAEGWRIDELIHTTTAFIVFLFAVMVVWMLWAVFRHNTKNHKARYEHGDSKGALLRTALMAGSVFFIVDGNLFYNAIVDLGTTYWNFEQFYGKKEPDVIRLEVNAHQWAWDARYAGPDGEFNTADDVVTLNDIRIPVDTPVWVQLTSTDVIHAFYLPNLRVKFDAMPGMVNQFWFEVKGEDAGHYDIACAQHCGVNHYKMKGQLTALSKEDFEAWIKQSSTNAARIYDPNANDVEAHWGWAWRERE